MKKERNIAPNSAVVMQHIEWAKVMDIRDLKSLGYEMGKETYHDGLPNDICEHPRAQYTFLNLSFKRKSIFGKAFYTGWDYERFTDDLQTWLKNDEVNFKSELLKD